MTTLEPSWQQYQQRRSIPPSMVRPSAASACTRFEHSACCSHWAAISIMSITAAASALGSRRLVNHSYSGSAASDIPKNTTCQQTLARNQQLLCRDASLARMSPSLRHLFFQLEIKISSNGVSSGRFDRRSIHGPSGPTAVSASGGSCWMSIWRFRERKAALPYAPRAQSRRRNFCFRLRF